MPKLTNLRERSHHEVGFRFQTKAWAYSYGLAMKAYEEFVGDQSTPPWDTIEDIAVGLGHAGYPTNKVEEMIHKARARDLSVFDDIPTDAKRLRASITHTTPGEGSFVVVGIAVSEEIPASTSYLSVDAVGPEKTLATVSLLTLSALSRMVRVQAETLGEETVRYGELLHQLQKPVVIPPRSTFGLSLHVCDVVPYELIVSLVGVLTKTVM